MRLPMHQLSARQLIDRCSKRPPEELAWQEFVRRFHATIHKGVSDVYARLSGCEHNVTSPAAEEVVRELVQEVYRRLTRNNSEALRQVKANHDDSMKNYLLLVCMNVTRDHIRGPVRQEGLRDLHTAPRFRSAFGLLLGEAKH